LAYSGIDPKEYGGVTPAAHQKLQGDTSPKSPITKPVFFDSSIIEDPEQLPRSEQKYRILRNNDYLTDLDDPSSGMS
jgi:hypothetical protein